MYTRRFFNCRRPPARRKQRGVVAILVGMTIMVMVGMVGLAIDLGQLFVSKTELQNAADACALAGVNAMPAGLESSESAATTVAQRHKVLFQKSLVGGANSTVSVQYSDSSVNGPFLSRSGFAASAKPNFVRCTVNRTSIGTYFIQVLSALPGVSIGESSVSALAIAKKINSQTSCAIPVAICQADVATAKKGEWIINDFRAPSATRGIRWVDFTKPGPASPGAADIGDLLTGAGQCALPSIGSDVYVPGVISSLPAAYNTRFGIYFGLAKAKTDIYPDFAGHGYSRSNWPSQKDAYDDFVLKRASNTPYVPPNRDSKDILIDVMGTPENSTFLKANGRDRRVVPVPVIDCDGLDTKETAKLSSWACVLLLHPITNNMASKDSREMAVEYLGAASDPTGPCASTGLPGGSGSGGPPVAALVR